MTDERNENWLERSLRTARAEVATWPEWKKKAMRVVPYPPPQERPRRDESGPTTSPRTPTT